MCLLVACPFLVAAAAIAYRLPDPPAPQSPGAPPSPTGQHDQGDKHGESLGCLFPTRLCGRENLSGSGNPLCCSLSHYLARCVRRPCRLIRICLVATFKRCECCLALATCGISSCQCFLALLSMRGMLKPPFFPTTEAAEQPAVDPSARTATWSGAAVQEDKPLATTRSVSSQSAVRSVLPVSTDTSDDDDDDVLNDYENQTIPVWRASNSGGTT